MPVQQLSPQEVDALRRGERPPVLIDVREPWEHATARIDGVELKPLGRFHDWSATLDRDQNYIVICHHGSRSDMVCQALQGLGFRRVSNLAGGIDAWSRQVDATIPRY